MPERDGYEVAAFIKGQPQLAHIPVLLLTGAFEPIDEARARSVGCDGVLVKPFEPQMVISRVRELLSGRRAPAQPVAVPPASSVPAPSSVPPPVSPADTLSEPGPEGEGQSLEDYFDRLDAALATLGPGTSAPQSPPMLEPIPRATSPAIPAEVPLAPPARVGDTLGGWDPELAGGPTRPPAAPIPLVPARPSEPVAAWPAPVAAPPPEPRPAAAADRPSTVPGVPAVPGVPSLSDAFAALLAAEQGHPVPPALFAVMPTPPPVVSEEMVEDIVRRVIDRMGDESMRRAVLDAADRLVREEIDRIKRGQAL
jgi:CheY-like chemotaxis protein